MTPKVSVILCTYNPRAEFFALALRSIGAQTLPYTDFEVLVVDNNSSTALRLEDVAQLAGMPIRLIRETKQGLTHARVAGIKSSRAQLLVFVDDDNELAHNYLETALQIAHRHPGLGAFGGIAEGVLEKSVSRFKIGLLPQLGIRNYGLDRIEGPGDHWGQWEPIGAGLVVQKSVADEFVRFVENNLQAGELGRKSGNLMSGEDSLFSRLAHRQNLLCAYEPGLSLRHYMSKNRLKTSYLCRLIYGHGRSYVLLASLTGEAVEKVPKSKLKLLAANFRHRLHTGSIASAAIMILWDAGYYDQMNNGD